MTTLLENFFKDQGLRPVGSLAHWGIKGMRWGIRRSDDELARANSSASADAVRARETLNTIKKTGTLASTSDADLNHLINRINTEKRYSDIRTSTFTKGHEQVKTILSVGDTANKAIQFANSPAGKLIADSLGLNKTTRGRHAKP